MLGALVLEAAMAAGKVAVPAKSGNGACMRRVTPGSLAIVQVSTPTLTHPHTHTLRRRIEPHAWRYAPSRRDAPVPACHWVVSRLCSPTRVAHNCARTPARVTQKLKEAGLVDIYERAGFTVGAPGCSYCLGIAADVAGDGEVRVHRVSCRRRLVGGYAD